MISILAVFAVDWSRPATLGLVERCTGLVDAARRQGFAVDAVFPHETDLRWYRPGDQAPSASTGRSHLPEGLAYLRGARFRYGGFWRKLTDAALPPYDLAWVRAFPASADQATFLARMSSSGCSVVYDLPTYPSAAENRSMWRGLVLARALPLTGLSHHVAAFVTLTADDAIAGRPVVRVRNGATLPPEPRAPLGADGPYRLLGLGAWAYWHALDRLFLGVAKAGLAARFDFRIAGEGPAVAELRALASDYGLRVDWRAPVYGRVRDALLDWADIGIGCLGIHRKNVYPDQALKHRQYAAAGLPFLATVADPQWRGLPEVWSIPSNETDVDAEQLLAFCERSRTEASSAAASLRAAATEVSWDRAYAPLWDYFRDVSPA